MKHDFLKLNINIFKTCPEAADSKLQKLNETKTPGLKKKKTTFNLVTKLPKGILYCVAVGVILGSRCAYCYNY